MFQGALGASGEAGFTGGSRTLLGIFAVCVDLFFGCHIGEFLSIRNGTGVGSKWFFVVGWDGYKWVIRLGLALFLKLVTG